MRRLLLLAFVIAAAVFLIRMAGQDASAPGAKPYDVARPKKVIEWGWDEPTTAFLRENIEKAEALPFDGVVIPLRLRDRTDVSWKMWSAERLDYDSLAYMADDLRNTPFKRLTDRFIRVNVNPGDVNWSSEDAWSAVLHNYAIAAKIAKEGNCKGLMFDTEPYTAALFSEAFANANGDAGREAHRQLLRQRGRELISAIAHEFPDITIIITHAYYAHEVQPKVYPYLPAFLDGMFEAAPSTVKLVDGWEFSYGYKRNKDFRWGYNKLKDYSPKFSSIPALVRKRLEAGFGIWLDATFSGKAWKPDNIAENYFTPAEFEDSVRMALATSEEYVWIYSEKLDWWRGRDIPPEYIEALRKARSPGKAPGL